jgi:hypothetical protein
MSGGGHAPDLLIGYRRVSDLPLCVKNIRQVAVVRAPLFVCSVVLLEDVMTVMGA